jgi:hypothetical protein
MKDAAERKDSESDEPDSVNLAFRGPIPVVSVDAAAGANEPTLIEVPSIVTGTIERAGDIDRVSFRAKAGDGIALEIETDHATLPDFNPFLKVVDEAGLEVFTNVHSNLNNNGGFIMKTINAKTVFRFARSGKFTLEIRDITTHNADDRFTYRVLVRPQVPHIGAVRIAEDHLNLVAGEIKKLSVVTDQEEGFDGYIGITADGLPAGVQVMMGTEVEPDQPPPLDDGKVERYFAKNEKVTLLLITEQDTPATEHPATVRIFARPVRNGKLGEPVLAKEVLLMVVKPPGERSQDRSAEWTKTP